MIVVTDRSHEEKKQGSPFFKECKECNGKLLCEECK